MLAYHNDVKIKEDILEQLQAHYEADEIVKGYYWKNGKGCAVGCTLHSSNHEEYEKRFGIPTQLAYLEERIFEGLPNDLAKEWPLKFMSSINVGADLSKVWPKFVIWLLSDPIYGIIQYAKNKRTRKFIQNVIDLHKKSLTEPVIETEFTYAAADAYASAAAYAVSAAFSDAASAAAFADAADASAAAAAFYADVASAAANSAWGAAVYAAASAGLYAFAGAYDYASEVPKNRCYIAKRIHYIAQSKKLIQILKNTF